MDPAAELLSQPSQDIFRKYPSTYEGVIPTLCANLDELDEPEAKASLIWIIGEYANKIDNADELLSIFVDTFTEESYAVSDLACPCSHTADLILSLGPTPNANGCRQTFPTQARLITRASPTNIEHCDEGL